MSTKSASFCIESHTARVIFMCVKITENPNREKKAQKFVIFVNFYCFYEEKIEKDTEKKISQEITVMVE